MNPDTVLDAELYGFIKGRALTNVGQIQDRFPSYPRNQIKASLDRLRGVGWIILKGRTRNTWYLATDKPPKI